MSARWRPASSTGRAGPRPAIAGSRIRTAREHRALVRVFQLPGGFRLLVGRDLEERERLRDIVIAAGRWSLAIVIVLGVAGGLFVTRRVLKRVDAMTETTRQIMDGDLTGRLPIAGTGDELDRLAVNLNAMLERIEALMRGLKEVSDNIAHDLKTPLTRLRNRCEEALRLAEDESQYRAALETTIEESDGLIRTFNALLMIARAESGQARDGMTDLDAAEIARGVGELYEPLADEKGIKLKVEAPSAAPVHGNRELISQALANLVDNAIKYGAPAAGDGARRSWCGRRARAIGCCCRVADGGAGIPAADRGRAVERFVRLEQQSLAAGLGAGTEPGGCRRAAAWRRARARGQLSRPQDRHLAAARGCGRGVTSGPGVAVQKILARPPTCPCAPRCKLRLNRHAARSFRAGDRRFRRATLICASHCGDAAPARRCRGAGASRELARRGGGGFHARRAERADRSKSCGRHDHRRPGRGLALSLGSGARFARAPRRAARGGAGAALRRCPRRTREGMAGLPGRGRGHAADARP